MAPFGTKVVTILIFQIDMKVFSKISSSGEANTGWNTDYYSCTFSQMIKEWRRIWSLNSNTNFQFPFGFVQLSTNQQDKNTGTALIRWHQTYDIGFVPNPVLQVNL